MANRWPLYVAGAALIFGGATLGTYLGTKDRQTGNESVYSEQPTRAVSEQQTRVTDSPVTAVQKLEERERVQQQEEKKRIEAKQDVERRIKTKAYADYKKNLQNAIGRSLTNPVVPDRLHVECANHLLCTLGIENRLDEYRELDINNPAVNFFCYRSAERAHTGGGFHDDGTQTSGESNFPRYYMSELCRRAVEIGETLPSREDIRNGRERWRSAFCQAYAKQLGDGRFLVELGNLSVGSGGGSIKVLDVFNEGVNVKDFLRTYWYRAPTHFNYTGEFGICHVKLKLPDDLKGWGFFGYGTVLECQPALDAKLVEVKKIYDKLK